MRRFSAWLSFFGVFAVAFLGGCQQKPDGERVGRTTQAAASACTALPTSLTISAPNDGETVKYYGDDLVVGVTVNGYISSPTGSITLSEPTTGLSCTRALTPGKGNATASAELFADCGVRFPAGNYTVSVNYPGDASYCSTSSSFSLSIQKASSAVGLETLSNSPFVYGQPVTFTASVGSGLTGTVTFYDNESPTDVAVSGGVATYSPTLSVADHWIWATYGGDANHDGSESSLLGPYTVNKADSSVTNPTVSPDPAAVGSTITFSAAVSPVAPSALRPAGTVTFRYYDSTATEFTPVYDACSTTTIDAQTGAVSCTSSKIPEGSWSVIAVFDPSDVESYNGTSSSAVDLTVSTQVSFTLTLTSSADAATTYYGTPVTFTATINTTGAAPTGTVDFYRSDNPSVAFASVALSTTGQVTSATTPAVLWTGGSWSVTAVYYGDDTHQNPPTCTAGEPSVCSPTPGTDTHYIYIAPHDTVTTFAVTAKVGTADAPVYGQTLTLTAGLAPTASPTRDAQSADPTGSISFYDGACFQQAYYEQAFLLSKGPLCSPLATVALTNGGATFDIASLAIGAHDLRAVYNGDGNYGSSLSSQSITIGPAPTKTAIATTTHTAVVNTPITLSATITVASPAALGGTDPVTPSASELEEGTVSFQEGDTTLGAGTLDPAQSTATQRVYTFTTSALTPGTHAITATYSGGPHFTTSTSSVLSQVINPDGVSATVVSTSNPATFGTDITLTATLTSTKGGTPTGTITFAEGATTLGTATLVDGVGSITLTSPSAGIHTIVLSYGGDTNHQSGELKTFTQTVQPAATTTSLSASLNQAQFGQPVSVTAHVTSAKTAATGTVAFSEAGVSLGSVVLSSGDAKLALPSTLSIGSHVIVASFAGSTNFGPSSASVKVVVTAGVSKLALATSLSPSLAGTDVTFTATVTAVAPSSGTPTGLVKFSRGGTPIGTVSLTAAGIASLTTNKIAIGTNEIFASYEGDANFGPSVSSLTQKVATNAAKIVLTAAPVSATFGQEVTLTASLTGTAAGIPTGTVTFNAGTVAFPPVDIDAQGLATFRTRMLSVGTLTLKAVYSGSDVYAAGSASIPYVVSKAPTKVTLTASPNPAKVDDAVTFNAEVSSADGAADGVVEVMNGTTSLGTITLTAGKATLTTNGIPEGTHAITVSYKGNDDFAASSTTITFIVNSGSSVDGSSSSSGAPGSSAPPSGTPNTSGGLAIAPGGGSDGGDGCSVSNVGGPSSTGLGLGLAIALAAAARRRRRR